MFSDLTAQKGATLLAPPALEGPVFDRVCPSSYTNCSERFKLGERSFSRQYAHIYATRLLQMRPVLTKRAQQMWAQPPTSAATSKIHQPIGRADSGGRVTEDQTGGCH
ncbi:DNA polymerase delta subunit 2 [Acipenser ruthenus]|uniref:DNA polymerase delta subunit 2 n=1 Tax=Acipenser ruthenus TaxID=7906 RepID=A0A444US56_ACIRT|nr:DNA polymerase delta subunit 2 [Acipenser ruthenus]